MRHNELPVAIGVGLGLVSSIALAQQPPRERAPQGFYGGLSLGQSKGSLSESSISGAATRSVSKEETDTAWKLFAGYRIHRNVAIEGGYTDFGKLKATRTVGTGLLSETGSVNTTVKITGFHLEGVGIIPFHDFSIFLKAGTLYSTTETTVSATGGIAVVGDPNRRKSEFNLNLGFGGAYEISRNWGVRVEYEKTFSVGDTGGDVGTLSLGGIYKF